MLLEKLSLLNFKNYTEAQMTFSEKFNCFVGNNGAGKTNILDAIHYISLCKSYFNSIDSQNIQHELPFFAIQAWIEKNGTTDEIYCALKRGQKKQFKRNKKEYERLSEHIGIYPLVMISPSDSELILDGSEVRRKFIDSIISQYDKHYLDSLISYNHALHQRNALLKYFYEQRQFDALSLEVWDDKLIQYGETIISKRNQFLDEFIPMFNANYELISGSNEIASIHYLASTKGADFKSLLQSNLERDKIVHHTTIGPHKDDLEFKLLNSSLKKFASQGQQKSYLLALKLAQFEFVKKKTNTKPLLLLDDIYDKLDESRFTKMIELVSSENFGQIFITDTHPERMKTLFLKSNSKHAFFIVDNGIVNQHG
jgi:DNA replication and repair protein RecF